MDTMGFDKSDPPRPGVYVPLLSFFKGEANRETDHDAAARQIRRLLTAGVNGLVVHAATGEPAHLGPAEYKEAIKTARAAIDVSGPGEPVTLVVGVSAPALWQTVERCAYAREFGADYVLVHAPSAYALDDAALSRYLVKTADWSKLPVILYETVGTPYLSEQLVRGLATHPNIVGLVSWRPTSTTWDIPGFAMFCGTGGLRANLGTAHGVVSPLANIAPSAVVRVWDAFESGDYEGAARAVAEVAPAGVVDQGGDAVVGIRYGLTHYFGWGGTSREPLMPPDAELKRRVVSWLDTLMDAESGVLPRDQRTTLSKL